MKRTFTFVACVGSLFLVAVGCQKKASDGVPMNESVVDVGAPPAGGYQSPSQVAPQPVVYDLEATAPNASASSDMGGMMSAGDSYTVKKGDTLYGIARQRYGDGKQWTRIAEANPGLRPETLKAGQTIAIP